MAKVKINKLPNGFKLVDGKVKKKTIKRDGGMITGDQADYGLVTTPQEFYGNTNFNNNDDQSVRYSLSRVPREDANIEAEGGETVLTDLNGNNQFGLYDIKGPRHSSGGVPMFLPEQSFVYSDTKSMRFNKDELAEFGLERGKKMTPAEVSKKYPLNAYYAEINSQYADDISTRSAELMLDKNMYNLSKLAFGQELKKDFEDGVPLAAFPYLQEQGIDPIEFTAQVEDQSKQQAELEFIASLPPDKQDQILRLQAMMQDIQDPNAGRQQVSQEPTQTSSEYTEDLANLSTDENELTATLQDGGEPKSDDGVVRITESVGVDKPQQGESVSEYYTRIGMEGMINDDRSGFIFDEERGGFVAPIVDISDDGSVDGTINENEVKENGGVSSCEGYQCNPLPVGHEQREAFEEKLNAGWVLTQVYDATSGKTRYTVTKPLSKNKFEEFEDVQFKNIEQTGTGDDIDIYTDLEKELIGVYQDGQFGDNVRVREGVYSRSGTKGTQSSTGANSYGGDLSTPEAEKDFRLRWSDAIDKVVAQGIEFDYSMPKGKWNGKTPVDAQAKKYYNQWSAVQNAMQEVENEFHYQNFGDSGKPRQLFPGDDEGGSVDGQFGMKTHSKSRSYLRTEKPESLEAEVLEEDEKERNSFEVPKEEQPEWWWQDLNNLATQNSLENPLFLPNIPRVPNTEIDYVLDDWTGRANMTNAALNTMAKNLRAFGKGKVAGSNLFGKAVNQLAKDVGNVNTNNVKIMNSVALPQAQLNLRTGLANAKAYQDEYDGTVTALQRYTDFENWDKQKSNELYNQAITNRANTFNMNQLRDRFKADPFDGGIIEQKDSTDLRVDTDDRTDLEKRQDTFTDVYNKNKKAFPKMSEEELIETTNSMITGDYGGSKNNKNNYEVYDDANDPSDLGYAPSVRSNLNRGGSMKKFAYPFYTGKMGA